MNAIAVTLLAVLHVGAAPGMPPPDDDRAARDDRDAQLRARDERAAHVGARDERAARVGARDAAQRALADAEAAQIGWRVGIGVTAAAIASAGVVGAVAAAPLQKGLQPISPLVANAVTPALLVEITAGAAFATGIALAVTAAVTDETPARTWELAKAQRALTER